MLGALWAVGDGWFVLLLGAAVVGIDPALRWLEPRRRRREWLVELPALAAGSLVLAWAVTAPVLDRQDAAPPVASMLRFAGYVLLWALALRQVHRLLLRWAERVPGLRRRLLREAVAAAVLVVGGLPQLFVGLQTHRVAVPQAPQTQFAAVARAVEFANAQGLVLRGTLLEQPRGSPRTPVVVVCHGLGGNHARFFDYAEVAFGLGGHVLAFDFRAHGGSDGVVSTMGALEVDDVLAAVAFARHEARLDGPLVLVGVSMGGATVLRAAAAAGAAAVFAESSYADLGLMLDQRMRMLGPAAPIGRVVARFAAWSQVGIDPDSVSPRQSLAALPQSVPVVLVHAEGDPVIPVAEGLRLAAARPGLELHLFADANHGGCLWADWRRVQALLQSLLTQVGAD
jgi:pimeloyl-ACP methyl ester carboxylesterase